MQYGYCFITINLVLDADIFLIISTVNKRQEWQILFYAFTGKIPFSRQVHNRFGVVTSFTGTYKADQWALMLPSSQGTNSFLLPT